MYNETINSKSLSREMSTGIAVALGSIGFCGFTFNLLVLIIIVKDSHHLWTPVNVILWNLAFGDMLVAIFGNPLALVSAIKGGWEWSHGTCLWYAWLMSTLGFASIGNLTVMALERYLLISRPLTGLSIKSALALAILVWVYAISLSVPPFFGWGSYGYEPGNVSCSVSWEVHDPITHSDTYIAFLFIFGMIMPVGIITGSYGGIIFTIRSVKKRTGGSARKRELKVTKMVALMVTAFLIAWTPYAAVAIATQYFYWEPPNALGVLPSILAKSSICYNPIIYAGLNSQFPQALRKLLGIKNSRNRSKGQLSDQTAGIVLTTRIDKA